MKDYSHSWGKIGTVFVVGMIAMVMVLFFGATFADEAFASGKKTFHWKFSTFVPSTSKAMGVQEKWWAREVEKRSNGQIKVKVYWINELNGPREMLMAIKSRLADVISTTPGYNPGELPIFNCGYLPFLGAKRVDHQILVQNRLVKESKPYIDEMDKFNAVWGGSYGSPSYNLMGKKPVRTCEDLKGLRIRALPNVGRVLSKFGAVPVTMPVSEIYSALQTGVIDTVAHSVSSFRSYRIDELSKYLTIDMDMGAQPCPIFINKNAWNELSEDLKKAVQSVIDDCAAFMWDLYKEPKFVAEMARVIKEQGIEVINFPDSERAKLIAQAEDSWEAWAKRASSYDAAKQALADYQKIRDEVYAQYPNGAPGIKYK